MKRPSCSRSIIAQYQTLYMRPSLSPGDDGSGTIESDATADPQ
jgi:hypothetical protein